ncbi:bile acid-CoA:amino acid N-acyltransferase-like [Styela clava]
MSDKKPRICVNKDLSLADQHIAISIEGLNAFQRVSLYAKIILPNKAAFESISNYIADSSGRICLQSDKSCGGTYEGVWPMGPLSSMVPSSTNERKYERFLIKDPMQPFTVHLQVYDTFISEVDSVPQMKHKLLTQHDITRTYAAPGVSEIEIWEGRIRGTLYIPCGSGKFPGVISMSGGYPGAMKHKAALLASRGFVALALKFFGADDLPGNFQQLDLGYFVEAAKFLKNHERVTASNGVGIIANCSGASLALATASCAPHGLIGCVVAISGWIHCFGHYWYEDQKWSPSSSMKKIKMTIETNSDGIVEWRYDVAPIMFKETPEEGSHFAFYKRLHTAYMFVYGGKDGYFPDTPEFVKMNKNLLISAKHPAYKFLFYQDAGHLIEHAFSPLAKVAWTFHEPHFNGGAQPGHGLAQEDSWPKILRFAYDNLTTNQNKL